jgi:DNA/RNA endonuclease YhcR with UshA esterase domain
MRKYYGVFLLVLLIALGSLLGAGQKASAQITITPAQATSHVGEVVTVCGTVASTRYASSTRGKPTFLNLGKAYPNQIFTVMIWGEDREKFGEPEEKYRDKNICVTGLISIYRGVPEIVVKDPKDIRIIEK